MRMMQNMPMLLTIMLICILLSACGPRTYHNSSTDKVWSVDSSGVVQTNDLERLQRETPFTIVIPEYIPDELVSVPVMYIKVLGNYSSSDIEVRFEYVEGTKMISIREVNYKVNVIPNIEMENIYFDISGTNVLQAKSQNLVGQLTEVTTYSYTWYQNGVSFRVVIWDYSEDECRKIIESMVK